MKKGVISIIIILTIILALFTGIYINKINNIKVVDIDTEDILIAQEISDECTEFATNYEIAITEKIIDTNAQQYKISPNDTLITKRYYKNCGHTITEYSDVTNDVINLTEEELIERYKDWNIEEFSDKKIILYKEIDESCGEHYIIKEKDEMLAIYKIDDNGNEILEKETGISIQYLTEADLKNIKQGIRANGKQDLNNKLEDFE